MILVRHGQSRHNIRETDDLNSGLTEKGIWQAEKTGEFLLTIPNIREYQIVSSPLKRAWQTSSIIGEILGCSIQPCWSICEHAHYDSGYPDHIFPLVINKHKDWVYHGYESDEEFLGRLKYFHHWSTMFPIKLIAVSHGLAIETLINLMLGKEEVGVWDGSCVNCSVSAFHPKTDVPNPYLMKYAGHLQVEAD